MMMQLEMTMTQAAASGARISVDDSTPTRAKKTAHRSNELASDVIDPTRIERALAVGSNRCRCGGCGRHFGGPSTFDRHQTLTADGDVVCHDPTTRGLEITWKGGYAWWSAPSRFGKDGDDAE